MQFKIRCSAIGQIMTNPRSKTETLSKTTMSYVQLWVKEQLYSRKNEFTNKYVQKGLAVEDASIDFIMEMLGYPILNKNEKQFSNDFMTGTPDMILPDHLIDVKNSWDCFTFPLFETECEKNYWWQGQGYMELTGRDHYKVVYILSDTPENLIYREAKNYCFNNGYDELDEDVFQSFVDKMTYPDIDNSFKIKTFEFDRDQAAIDSIKDRVIACNHYAQQLIKQLKNERTN